MNIQAHDPSHMAYGNERGRTFTYILTGFLIFATYFICKIVKGVRKSYHMFLKLDKII